MPLSTFIPGQTKTRHWWRQPYKSVRTSPNTMIRIQLRDGGRVSDQTGYGQFNRSIYLTLKEMGIKVGHDKEPLPEANVHLFISPPYSFTDLEQEKLNVGLTMTERESLDGY